MATNGDLTIRERVRALTQRFASASQPVTVTLDVFSLVLPIPADQTERWRQKGLLPFSSAELAWLVAAREHLNATLDVRRIIHAKAVLPSDAHLGGILVTPQHAGDPYFLWEGHPTVVVCAHAQPPTSKGPTLVVTPTEVTELLEAGVGTFMLLAETQAALPGAHDFCVVREGECRGELACSWHGFSIQLCDHIPPEGQRAAAPAGRVFLSTAALPHLAQLAEQAKEAVLTVLLTFPGARPGTPPD